MYRKPLLLAIALIAALLGMVMSPTSAKADVNASAMPMPMPVPVPVPMPNAGSLTYIPA